MIKTLVNLEVAIDLFCIVVFGSFAIKLLYNYLNVGGKRNIVLGLFNLLMFGVWFLFFLKDINF